MTQWNPSPTAEWTPITSRWTLMNSRGSPLAQGGRITSPSLVPFCLQPVELGPLKRKWKTWWIIRSYRSNRNSGLRFTVRSMKSYHQKGPPEIIYSGISLRRTLSTLPQRDLLSVCKAEGCSWSMTSGNDQLHKAQGASFLQDSSKY